MSKNELEKIWDCDVDLPYRQKVEELQQIVLENFSSDVDISDNGNKVVYPSATKYNHYFSDGLYVREMFCEKDYFGFTVIFGLLWLYLHFFYARIIESVQLTRPPY